MKAHFHRLTLLDPHRAPGDGMNVGVAQVRQYTNAARTAVLKEGAAALVILGEKGERVDVLLTPEEALGIGQLLIASACAAADERPSMIAAGAVATPPPPPRVIQ